MRNITTKQLVRLAFLSAILFAQEQALSFIANIQLTVLLLVVYSRTEGFWKTIIIITIHVLLDNLIMGSFNLFYIVTMMIGWSFIPLIFAVIFKKVEKIYLLAILSVLCSLFYCWCFLIATVLMFDIDIFAYLVSDILFEVLMAASSFISIIWLYKPLSQALIKIN